MSKTKAILFVLAAVILTFGNTLDNGLIGDDRALFTENSFYKDPANLQKIFHKDILTPPDRLSELNEEGGGYSGTVSYRPVTVLTFFVDGLVWKADPRLLHLENLLLHAAVCVLAFIFLLRVTGKLENAFLAALLFAVHPVQSEAVNTIGYRSDILAALFYLSALINFAAFRAGEKGGWWRLGACWLSFAIALFSKESAVMLPVTALSYDAWLAKGAPNGTTPRKESVQFWKTAAPYAGFAAVLSAYFFVYFVAIPTQYYLHAAHLGKNYAEHVLIMVRVFAEYAASILMPLNVKILPTLYAPLAGKITTGEILLAAGFVMLMLIAGARSYRKNRRAVTFFAAWFFINYLPVSDITPLLNPVAYRFLYLPLLGAAAVAAHYIGVLAERLELRRSRNFRAGLFLKFAIVGVCVAAAVPNNAFFKNDFTASTEMVRNYPDSSRPYWILGLVYMEKKEYQKAKEYFLKYMRTDPRNPFISIDNNYTVHHMLGRCEIDDPAKAIKHFKKALRMNPHFEILYSDLAKAYLLLGDYKTSLQFARGAIALKDDLLCAYPFAIHSLIETGQITEAETLLEKAESLSTPDDPNWTYLRNKIKEAKKGEAGGR